LGALSGVGPQPLSSAEQKWEAVRQQPQAWQITPARVCGEGACCQAGRCPSDVAKLQLCLAAGIL